MKIIFRLCFALTLGLCVVVGTIQAQQQTLNWEPINKGLPEGTGVNAFSWISNRFGPGLVILAGTGGAGLYRSYDNGDSWSRIDGATTGFRSTDIRAFTISSITIYAGTKNGIYRSINQGSDWTIAGSTTNGLTSISITSLAVGLNFSLYAGTIDGGLFRSTDNGTTWKSSSVGINTPAITALNVIDNSTILAGTPRGIFRSTNNGDTWTFSNRGIPEYVQITGFTGFGTSVYASTFGAGVFRSTDFGLTWTPVNTGLPNLRITSVAVINLPNSSVKPLLVSTYGNGVFLSNNDGASWGQASYNIGNVKDPSSTPIFVTRVAIVETTPFAALLGATAYRATRVNAPPPIITSFSPASATAGTQDLVVTIEGANFNAPTVTLDGKTLELVSSSQTRLVVKVPASEISYETIKVVEVKNADGQKDNAGYRITAPTAPFITKLNPPSDTVQANPLRVAIVGSNFQPDATVIFNGVLIPPERILGRLSTLLIVNVPIEAVLYPGRVPVRVTNPKSGEFAEVLFTIKARPPKIATLTPPAVSVNAPTFNLAISGEDFFTTATVSIGGMKLDILNQSTTQIIAVIPSALITTIGSVTVTVTNPDGQFKSTQLKVVEFGLGLTASESIVCPGAPVQITGTILGGVGNYRIVSWTPAVSSSTLIGKTIQALVNPTVTTTYTLKLADNSNAEIQTAITIGVLQPSAVSEPLRVAFDTVNTFFTRIDQKTIIIRNTSSDNTTLTLGTPRTTTDNFAVITPVAGTILLGKQTSMTITVQFNPLQDGFVSDTLLIPYNPCGNVIAIPLSGRRITPVLPPPVPVTLQTGASGNFPANQPPTFSWSAVTFAASYSLQIARIDRNFTLANGFDGADFPIATTANTSLQPTFALQPNTAYAWTVRAVNSATTSTWTVPQYFITAPTGVQQLSLLPTKIDFGSTIVNDTERRGIQLTNPGNATQTIMSVDFFPAAVGSGAQRIFDISGSFTRNIVNPLLPANAVLTFRPTDTIPYQGVIRIRTATDTFLALLVGRGVTCNAQGVPDCAETEITLRFQPPAGKTKPDVGDTISMQLVMKSSQRLTDARYAAKAKNYSAEIIIQNPDVFFPTAIVTPGNLSAQQKNIGRARVRLNDVPANRGAATSEVVLGEIRGLALLADTLSTQVRIAEFVWTDSGLPDASIRRTLTDATLSVETCTAGGSPRLLIPNPALQLTLVQAAPNPVSDQFNVDFIVHTDAHLDIVLVDVMGRKVKTFTSKSMTADTYTMTFATNDLVTGSYLLVLQTPLQVVTHRLEILK